MRLHEPELVDGTRVTIGRRVLVSNVNGKRFEKIINTYTASYKDADGKWRQDALHCTNRREARRKAIEIQMRVEAGKVKPPTNTIELLPLVDRYENYCKAKGLAPKTLWKYSADLEKLRQFLRKEKIRTVPQFDAMAFYRFRQWLEASHHKQGTTYAPKTVYTALTLAKQVCKWAWSERICDYVLVGVKLPLAKARPQPCFTTPEIDKLLATTSGDNYAVFAILAFTGMRIGELIQLQWMDVILSANSLGMIHIRRGGSGDTTKDKDERYVPIHLRIRPIFDSLPRRGELVIPGITERMMLGRLKAACEQCGLSRRFKLHSFRHYFASLCANHRIAHRKALAWLGHSSSDILEHYYHLSDDESESAMRELAQPIAMINAAERSR